MKEKKQTYTKESQLTMDFSSNVIKQVSTQSNSVETGKLIRLSANVDKSNTDYSALILKYTKSF